MFNVYDVYEIQESLEAYTKVLEWLPVMDKDEEVQRTERIKYTKFLIAKCDDVIEELREDKDE